MKRWRFPLCAVVVLWLAGAFQLALAPRMSIFGADPDLLIVSISCLGILSSRMASTFVGFVAGVIHGALAGANLAAYAISRSLAGFFVGWSNSLEMEGSVIVALATTLFATIVAQVVVMFIEGPKELGSFLLATIAVAMYNGVIAVPVYALLKWIVDPPQR